MRPVLFWSLRGEHGKRRVLRLFGMECVSGRLVNEQTCVNMRSGEPRNVTNQISLRFVVYLGKHTIKTSLFSFRYAQQVYWHWHGQSDGFVCVWRLNHIRGSSSVGRFIDVVSIHLNTKLAASKPLSLKSPFFVADQRFVGDSPSVCRSKWYRVIAWLNCIMWNFLQNHTNLHGILRTIWANSIFADVLWIYHVKIKTKINSKCFQFATATWMSLWRISKEINEKEIHESDTCASIQLETIDTVVSMLRLNSHATFSIFSSPQIPFGSHRGLRFGCHIAIDIPTLQPSGFD